MTSEDLPVARLVNTLCCDAVLWKNRNQEGSVTVQSTPAPIPHIRDPGMTARTSAYPMVHMSDAFQMVLDAATPLTEQKTALHQCLDLVLAQDVLAEDGYAVVASDGPGVYPVLGDVTAGIDPSMEIKSGSVAYITTGAPVPKGADAVIMVERTEAVDGEPGKVKLLDAVKSGESVRPIGYDIAAGQTVAAKGERLGAAEIGLLASLGVTSVLAYPRPRVAVLSTGDELVEATEKPAGGKIRDSNRPMLLAAVVKAGGVPVDCGIVQDKKDDLEKRLLEAVAAGDIVVLSGGVSMGSLDLIKPILAKHGTVHFGRLMMKPGKPTTFATIQPGKSHSGQQPRPKLVFALPGNPVSALVTFQLLTELAIRRMAGLPHAMPTKIVAHVQQDIKLDPARPEYHRAWVQWSEKSKDFTAGSTGLQASSRLLSLRGANGLLEIPAGSGTITAGSQVSVIITGPLDQPPPKIDAASQKHGNDLHACRCHIADSPAAADKPAAAAAGATESKGDGKAPGHHQTHHHVESWRAKLASSSHSGSAAASASGGAGAGAAGAKDTAGAAAAAGQDKSSKPASAGSSGGKAPFRVALLVVSDRVSKGEAKDLTGPTAVSYFQQQGSVDGSPISLMDLAKDGAVKCVADETDQVWEPDIADAVREWTARQEPPHLIVTLGGTGFSPRDRTPEAVAPLLQRQAPGFVQIMLAAGLKFTPMAVLSRPVAGIRNQSIGVVGHASRLLCAGADMH